MKIKQARNILLTAVVLAGTALSQAVTTVSDASWKPIVAPDSIAAAFGSGFSTQTFTASGQPLPPSLGGVTVTVMDSAKTSSTASLYMVSSGQINYLVPATAAVGAGSVSVTNAGTGSGGQVEVSNVAPAIFTANQTGTGVAAAQFLRVSSTNSATVTNTFTYGSSSYQNNPVSLSPSDKVYLVLYGTGIRRHSLNPVQATISGTKVPVLYAGPVSGYAGLDQINIGPLPQSLAGTGKGGVSVQVTVDGVPANAITINIQ